MPHVPCYYIKIIPLLPPCQHILWYSLQSRVLSAYVIEFAAISEQSPFAASGWSGRVLTFLNGDDGDGHGAEVLKGFMSV
jgi:hypothetical protein